MPFAGQCPVTREKRTRGIRAADTRTSGIRRGPHVARQQHAAPVRLLYARAADLPLRCCSAGVYLHLQVAEAAAGKCCGPHAAGQLQFDTTWAGTAADAAT